MKKNTFKVLFYIRGNQINKEGKAPTMIRIAIDGEVEQLNSKLTIEPQLWDVAASKARGRSAKSHSTCFGYEQAELPKSYLLHKNWSYACCPFAQRADGYVPVKTNHEYWY
jgi:hypothetical protein